MSVILPREIARRADEAPDQRFIQEIGGAEQTYGEFQLDTRCWAAALADFGIGEGDLVATMIPVSLTVYHCWMGLAWLGAIDVPVNHEYRGQLLTHVLNNSEARFMVASSRFLNQILEVIDQLPHLEKVIVFDATELPPTQRVELIAGLGSDAKAEPKLRIPDHWDIAGVMYTSGTTGTSKGVLCSWAYLAQAPGGTFPPADPVDDGAYYAPWQPYHLTGRVALQMAAQMNLRLVLRERFSLSSWWDDVRQYNCTHALCAFLGAWMWNQPRREDDADNPMKYMTMSPLIPQVAEFEERFGLELATTYASVEAGFAVQPARSPKDHRICGRIRDGFEIRIVDEHDQEVPSGEKGELIIRGDRPWTTFGGYFNDPAATGAIWRNGWIHTGDAFRSDEEGNLYFVDRIKDYIKHRGQKIAAAEVETEVVAHADVVECACIGVPSDLTIDGVVGGDDVRIFVVTTDKNLDVDDLAEFLVQRMPRFMVPRYIDFVDRLPKNHLHKVMKNELRALPISETTWDREQVSPRNGATSSATGPARNA